MSEHREAWRVLAAALALLIGPLACLSLGAPLSLRGLAWLLSLATATIGCVIASRRSLRIAGLGAIAWLATIALTIAWPEPEHRFLTALVLPSGEPAPRSERIFAERDASFTAFRLMRAIGAVGGRELEGFFDPLARVYDEIDGTDGAIGTTPFVPTVLGSQGRDRFDTLVHDEDDRWVVFLHGYGGSFVSYCWVVARAAAESGWSTACPAMSLDGRWDRGDGPVIARRALRWIRERGARTIVLAGLSNGGIGASRLAPELEGELAGLVLLSGLDYEAEPTSLPTLVWHGVHDTHFSIDSVREWAATAPSARLVEIDGDHFALIEQRAELTHALRAFLDALPR